jgi:hypothetical protein
MPESADDLLLQLDKLRKARASGILTVTYLGNGTSRSVTWKSDRELNAAIQDLERRIAAMQSGNNRTIRVSSSKGLGERD